MDCAWPKMCAKWPLWLATTVVGIVQPRRKTYPGPNSTTSDECAQRIRRESQARILNLAIISEARVNSLSNSQRYFVLIPILALWLQEMRAIMDWWSKWAKQLVMIIVSTVLSLTVGWVSNLRPLLVAEPNCLGMGTLIGGFGNSVCASVANAVAGAWSTTITGTTSTGKILKKYQTF